MFEPTLHDVFCIAVLGHQKVTQTANHGETCWSLHDGNDYLHICSSRAMPYCISPSCVAAKLSVNHFTTAMQTKPCVQPHRALCLACNNTVFYIYKTYA